jgi:hypothetical protein
MVDDQKARDICINLYGECTCLLNGRAPCEAMLSLVSNDETAEDERVRMALDEAP